MAVSHAARLRIFFQADLFRLSALGQAGQIEGDLMHALISHIRANPAWRRLDEELCRAENVPPILRGTHVLMAKDRYRPRAGRC